MPTVKLTKFTQELQTSWSIFLKTWRASFKLVFLPIIPLLFTVPYLIEMASSLQYGQLPTLTGSTIYSFILALVGVIAFLMLSEIIRASLFVIYTNNETGARKALQIGTKLFPKFLYTDVLSFLYLLVAMVPLFILIFWMINGGREMIYGIFNPILGDVVLLIALIIFLAPPLILAIWLSFTQIIVATGKSSGIRALTHSTTLIRPIFKGILKRIVIWLIVYVVISYMVSPLPIAYWLIPLILKLIGAAFLVVLYQEASGALKVPAAATPITRTRRVARRSEA